MTDADSKLVVIPVGRRVRFVAEQKLRTGMVKREQGPALHDWIDVEEDLTGKIFSPHRADCELIDPNEVHLLGRDSHGSYRVFEWMGGWSWHYVEAHDGCASFDFAVTEVKQHRAHGSPPRLDPDVIASCLGHVVWQHGGAASVAAAVQDWVLKNCALPPLPDHEVDVMDRPLRDMPDDALAWRAGDAVITRDWHNLWYFVVEYRERVAERKHAADRTDDPPLGYEVQDSREDEGDEVDVDVPEPWVSLCQGIPFYYSASRDLAVHRCYEHRDVLLAGITCPHGLPAEWSIEKGDGHVRYCGRGFRFVTIYDDGTFRAEHSVTIDDLALVRAYHRSTRPT